MTTLCSYDLNGKKLSFANWISNLSPQDTPFSSMTGKESINQTLFQWQTDYLNPVGENAVYEGSFAKDTDLRSTTVLDNVTQILRKTVKVSDTSNKLSNYGRGKELAYQMEKVGKELKRDIEWALLNNKDAVKGNETTPRQTAGFRGLVAGHNIPDPSTGAVVHMDYLFSGGPLESELFRWTYNMYLSGSSADIIMFHPKHASLFSALQEKIGGSRKRLFENTPKFSVEVSTITDPLGQVYKLIPNRWMPEDCFYCFNTSDFTQMILRAPQRIKLSKKGSAEKWMIETELGLRLRHPYAAGVLRHKTSRIQRDLLKANSLFMNNFTWKDPNTLVKVGVGGGLMIGYSIVNLLTRLDETVSIIVYKGEKEIARVENKALGTDDFIDLFDGTSRKAEESDSGRYMVYCYSDSYESFYEFILEVSGRSGDIIPIGDLIQSATCDGKDAMTNDVFVDATEGSVASDILQIIPTEEGKGATVKLYKVDNEGRLVLKETSDFSSGTYSFGLNPASHDDAGRYRAFVEVSGKVETTQFIVVNVEDSGPTPDLITDMKFDGFPLPEGGVVNKDEGSNLVISFNMSSQGSGSTLRFLEASTMRPLLQKSGREGANMFSYPVKLSDKDSGFLVEATTYSGTKHYSVMFKLDVTPKAMPETTDIFWEEHSYIGSTKLSAGEEVVIEIDPGTFNDEYISMYQRAQGQDSFYYLINKATGKEFVAQVTDIVPIKDTNNDYVYLSGMGLQEQDSGVYFIKAMKDGKQQVSSTFTISLTN